ncbi:MAG: cytochrome c [Myxococcales bacterium]|nr:cytochrome c [Myxococcales bacterium]
MCSALGLAGVGAGCGEPSPAFTEPMVLGGREVSPQVLERGARVYALFCVSCHGSDGSGRGNASRSFDKPPRDFREGRFEYVSGPEGSLPTDEDLAQTILKGRPGTGMPAWNGLSPEDLQAVIDYLKTFSDRWKAEAPGAGASPQP